MDIDIEGKYFPDEEEPDKKKPSLFKKVLKNIFFSIGILVWVLFILLIIIRRDNPIVKTVILSDQAREVYTQAPDEFKIYEVFTKEFMNIDGSIEFKTNVYAHSAGEIEIGVRLSSEIFGGDTSTRFHYTLTDSEGNEYPITSRVTREKDIYINKTINFQYIYERISFGGIYLDMDKNIINRDPDESTEVKRYDDEEPDEGTEYDINPKMYINIYYQEGDETPLFRTALYTDRTYIKEISYKVPKSKYLD